MLNTAGPTTSSKERSKHWMTGLGVPSGPAAPPAGAGLCQHLFPCLRVSLPGAAPTGSPPALTPPIPPLVLLLWQPPRRRHLHPISGPALTKPLSPRTPGCSVRVTGSGSPRPKSPHLDVRQEPPAGPAQHPTRSCGCLSRLMMRCRLRAGLWVTDAHVQSVCKPY